VTGFPTVLGRHKPRKRGISRTRHNTTINKISSSTNNRDKTTTTDIAIITISSMRPPMDRRAVSPLINLPLLTHIVITVINTEEITTPITMVTSKRAVEKEGDGGGVGKGQGRGGGRGKGGKGGASGSYLKPSMLQDPWREQTLRLVQACQLPEHEALRSFAPERAIIPPPPPSCPPPPPPPPLPPQHEVAVEKFDAL
jgi:hypothetical protein